MTRMVSRTHSIKISVLVKARLLSLNGDAAIARELAEYMNNNNFGFDNGVRANVVAAIINRRSKVPNDMLECVQTRKRVSNNNFNEYYIPRGAK